VHVCLFDAMFAVDCCAAVGGKDWSLVASTSAGGPWPCSECKSVLMSSGARDNHMKRHHGMISTK
jgi:hypothetical protein